MLLFNVYNIECGLSIYLSTKRRGCVHPLRPPSSNSNHCEEVLSFPDKAANLRLIYLAKSREHRCSLQQVLYSFWLRFHSMPRDSAGPSFTILFFFCPRTGHILLSLYTTKFYHFVNKSFNACCRILLDVFIVLGEMIIIRVISFARVDDKSWYLWVCTSHQTCGWLDSQ